MKKILIFADSFLPGFKGGGPVTSIANLVKILNNDFNILICTRNHDFGDVLPYKDIVSDNIIKYKEYNIIYLSSMNIDNISKVIKKFNPDLLYLNSFFSTTTQKIMYLNKIKYNKKMIVAPRGELQTNALSIKKTKKMIYLFVYKLFKLYTNISFHSTDKIETKSIQKLFDIDNITTIQNTVFIKEYKPLVKKQNTLKVIFVSRISRKKNLHFALEILKDVKCNLIFDIYGPKEDIEYWNVCQNIINKMPSNIKVSYNGSLSQDKIMNKMREYHCFLFPTLSENFGHVIVESMQAGLIPIISDQTPWLNLKNINAGWDISLDNKIEYIKVIEELYKLDDKSYKNKSLTIMGYIKNKLNIHKLTAEYKRFFINNIR
jgi:glycosyltransferase involved in cell wall biosynthesis